MGVVSHVIPGGCHCTGMISQRLVLPPAPIGRQPTRSGGGVLGRTQVEQVLGIPAGDVYGHGAAISFHICLCSSQRANFTSKGSHPYHFVLPAPSTFMLTSIKDDMSHPGPPLPLLLALCPLSFPSLTHHSGHPILPDRVRYLIHSPPGRCGNLTHPSTDCFLFFLGITSESWPQGVAVCLQSACQIPYLSRIRRHDMLVLKDLTVMTLNNGDTLLRGRGVEQITAHLRFPAFARPNQPPQPVHDRWESICNRLALIESLRPVWPAAQLCQNISHNLAV